MLIGKEQETGRQDVPCPAAEGRLPGSSSCCRFLMTYLAALPLGGDLSKAFKELASLTCGLCGLAQHLAPHNFHPGWMTDQSGAPVRSDYSHPVKGGSSGGGSAGG